MCQLWEVRVGELSVWDLLEKLIRVRFCLLYLVIIEIFTSSLKVLPKSIMERLMIAELCIPAYGRKSPDMTGN